jgi:hypothetical protein
MEINAREQFDLWLLAMTFVISRRQMSRRWTRRSMMRRSA